MRATKETTHFKVADFLALDEAQRLAFLQDTNNEFSLAEKDVDTVLNNKDEVQSLEYLNALSKRVQFSCSENPIRPSTLVHCLNRAYRTRYPQTWDKAAEKLFENLLTYPAKSLTLYPHICEQLPITMLLALLEQYTVLEATKRSVFLIGSANAANQINELIRQSVTAPGAPIVKLTRQDDSLSLFAECCATLAEKCTAEQGAHLLERLINDPDLHSCIPSLLRGSKTHPAVLMGYKKPYLEAMERVSVAARQSGECNPKLITLLAPFAGLIIDRMNAQELSGLLVHLLNLGTQHNNIGLIVTSFENGTHLPDDIKDHLVKLFTAQRRKGDPLKKVLYPKPFSQLSEVLLSRMSKQQCVAVAGNPDLVEFCELAPTIMLKLPMPQRLKLLENERVVITPQQLETLLAGQDTLPLEYLNALSRRFQYENPNNPMRPKTLIEHLERAYAAEKVMVMFNGVLDPLANPQKALLADWPERTLESLPLALLEQYAILEATKNMYFLIGFNDYKKQFKEMQEQRITNPRSVITPPKRKDPKGESAFARSHTSLVQHITPEQAERLLSLLIKDSSLHECISLYMHGLNENERVGYKTPYLQAMLDPKASSNLIDKLLDFRGHILEKMTVQEATQLVEHFITTSQTHRLQQLLRFRYYGTGLSPAILDYLVTIFTSRANESPLLKESLYPATFTDLSAALMNRMSKEQQHQVLSDPAVIVSVELIERLDFVKKNVDLISPHLDILIKRAMELSPIAIIEIINRLIAVRPDLIPNLFRLSLSETLEDKPRQALRIILLKHHFVILLPALLKTLDLKTLCTLFDNITYTDESLKLLSTAITALLGFFKEDYNNQSDESDLKIQQVAAHVFSQRDLLSQVHFIGPNYYPLIKPLLNTFFKKLSLDTLKPALDSLLNKAPDTLAQFRDFLRVALGEDILQHGNEHQRRGVIRADIVDYLLAPERLPEAFKRSISATPHQFLQPACFESVPFNIFKTLIDLGCKPNIDTLEAEGDGHELCYMMHTPPKKAYGSQQMDKFKLLIPTIDSVPTKVFDRAIVNHRLDMFVFLLAHVEKTDPHFFNRPELPTLFDTCNRSRSFITENRTNKAHFFLGLVQKGVEPSVEQVNALLNDLIQQNLEASVLEKYTLELLDALEIHSPNTYLLLASEKHQIVEFLATPERYPILRLETLNALAQKYSRDSAIAAPLFQIASARERHAILVSVNRPRGENADVRATQPWIQLQKNLLAHVDEDLLVNYLPKIDETLATVAAVDEDLHFTMSEMLFQLNEEQRGVITALKENQDKETAAAHISKLNNIIALKHELNRVAQVFSSETATDKEKQQAKEDFEKCCAPKLYSDTMKTVVYALIGALVGLIIGAILGTAFAIVATGGFGALLTIPSAALLGLKTGITIGTSAAVGGFIGGFFGSTRSNVVERRFCAVSEAMEDSLAPHMDYPEEWEPLLVK
jgi:hypothetical protein